LTNLFQHLSLAASSLGVSFPATLFNTLLVVVTVAVVIQLA